MKPISLRIKRFQPLDKPEKKKTTGTGDGLFEKWDKTAKYTRHLSTTIPMKTPDAKGLEMLRKAFGFGHDFDKLVFYDTETTGLSAGAGSLAFLAGFGRYENGSFTIDQYFLMDFPGEKEFLDHVANRLDRSLLFVSYNGKAFDRHLLKSRLLMNAMKVELPEQFDLLFPSRSLWQSVIGSCSLSNVESRVLGVKRGLDIPGEEIPDVYFDFLRTGDDSRMSAVVEHHRQDIVSLVLLLARLAEIFADPHKAADVDRARLARFLKRIDPAKAEQFSRACFDAGDRGCGIELSRDYKKSRDWRRAAEIWENLLKSGDGIFAAVELAKHHEHRTKDLKKALLYVEKCLGLPEGRAPEVKSALLHRKERLTKKLESKTPRVLR